MFDLLHNSDTQLFTKMCVSGHSLYHLIPPQHISTCVLEDTICCLIIVLHCKKVL